jgi:hypothetical protein
MDLSASFCRYCGAPATGLPEPVIEGHSRSIAPPFPAPGTGPGVPRKKKRRKRFYQHATVAWIAALLLAAAGVSVYVIQSRDLRTSRAQLSTETNAIDSLRKAASDLRIRISTLRTKNFDLTYELQNLRSKIKSSVGNIERPHFVLWNSCGAADPGAGCSLTPGYEYVGGVPDTFTYFVKFHSTVPVTVWIMSPSNFVCWETHTCPWHGVGWESRTHVNGVFHDAEGCAGYISVFVSDEAGTLYPKVSITRNPAAEPTGVCASPTQSPAHSPTPACVEVPASSPTPCGPPYE